MRLIGHLPSEANATTSAIISTVEGITNEVDSGKDGWAVGSIRRRMAQGKEMLAAFSAIPRIPGIETGCAGRQLKAAAAAKEEETDGRILDAPRSFAHDAVWGGPLTCVLVGLS